MKQIEIENIKKLTDALFASQTFDSFCVVEASFSTMVNITIDGHVNQDFFKDDEEAHPEQIALWKQVRGLCYEAIKGSKAPLRFKIVLMTPPDKVEGFLRKQDLHFNAADVAGLFINIRFENGKLNCISGTSTKTFSLDKSLENAWDLSVETFIKRFA